MAIRDDLAEILAGDLNKKFKGTKVAYFLDGSDQTPTDVDDFISTGSDMLDLAISNRPNGGIAVGRITEINGLESSGKSLLGAHLLAETQKKGGVGIGTTSPDSKLHVNGDFTTTNITASAIISGSQKVLSHEYHYCYHTTADDFKGDIVRFGTGPAGDVGNLVAGKLYCYQSDTHWELADADVQANATGMLGICIADGVNSFLVKGFAASALYTSLDTAGPIFISATAGGFTATAPASSNQYVRVVGYCTDATSRAIYFDPDKTWVKRS